MRGLSSFRSATLVFAIAFVMQAHGAHGQASSRNQVRPNLRGPVVTPTVDPTEHKLRDLDRRLRQIDVKQLEIERQLRALQQLLKRVQGTSRGLHCQADGVTMVNTFTGATFNCTPYRCIRGIGLCFSNCKSSIECARGYRCGAEDRCVKDN